MCCVVLVINCIQWIIQFVTQHFDVYHLVFLLDFGYKRSCL